VPEVGEGFDAQEEHGFFVVVQLNGFFLFFLTGSPLF
jgi:hypothetical protein